MTKFESCVRQVRRQKRKPGKRFWALRAIDICKTSCRRKKKK